MKLGLECDLRFVILLLIMPTVLAAQPRLSLPIDCTLGEDCFIQQFMDRIPGPEASDFECGSLVYDGHKGTDFALNSLASQRAGIDVLAAAPGTVRGVRDEMPDVLFGKPGAPDVKGRECGNGVVITHGDGWETQYCHLALGSVRVAAGDQVSRGTVLGQVGLSGRTQFPHLHLSVRHKGAEIDPFEPDGNPDCGADPSTDLWDVPVPTPAGGLIALGFSDAVPQFEEIKAGTAAQDRLGQNAPALVLWAYMFGSRAGDKLVVSILDPNGEVFYKDTFVLKRSQAQLFRAGGRRMPAAGWTKGTHIGTVEMVRQGFVIDRQTVELQLGVP